MPERSSSRSSFELFLQPAGGAGQSLARGLEAAALARVEPETPAAAAAARQAAAGAARSGGAASPDSFLDSGGDPASLRDQGWGVIAPSGPAGDRLLAQVRPLIEQRAADQDGEVAVYRVPAEMTAARAAAWIDRKLIDNEMHSQIPGYLMVLGRPDEVSFELQQVLATGFQVGRLGFDREADYEAYVDKLLRSERGSAASGSAMSGSAVSGSAVAGGGARSGARAVYFTARDGTPATELGRRLLMQPCLADAEQQRATGRFAASEVLAIEDDDPVRAIDRLVAAAAGAGVVFSCSHGAGAPPGGWKSPERRRAEQGALCLGRGQQLAPEAIARAPFAPGGVWLMFACFGAGTPRHSAYHTWLARLDQAGEASGDVAAVLASLPGDGEPPFLAALPQAALANPEGPLAIIGHLDLAWSYGFQDLDKLSRGERHRRFHELVAQLLRGTPVGLALGGSLMRARNQVQTELGIAAADEADAEAAAAAVTRSASGEPLDQRIRLGHRWMVLQDLAGYIALGDPAARLAVARRGQPAERAARAGDGGAEAASAAAAATPAASPPAIAIADAAAAAASQATAAAASPAAVADLAAREAAVHDVLAGRASLADIAARCGVEPATVDAWRRAYTEAGRRALAALPPAGASTR